MIITVAVVLVLAACGRDAAVIEDYAHTTDYVPVEYITTYQPQHSSDPAELPQPTPEHTTDNGVIITYQRIHESLPTFRFTQTFDGVYASMVITDEAGEWMQEIGPLRIDFPFAFRLTIEFDDYNFNGFLDMRIQRDGSSGAGFPWKAFYFWLWDTEVEMFIKNERLDEITSGAYHWLDAENQQLFAFWHHRAGSHRFTNRFDYINGDFVHAVSEEWEHLGRSGIGHDHGMAWTIRTHYVMNTTDIELSILAPALSDAEIEEHVTAITDRVARVRRHIIPIMQPHSVRMGGHFYVYERGTPMNAELAIETFPNYLNRRSARIMRIASITHTDRYMDFELIYDLEENLIFVRVQHDDGSSYRLYFYNDVVIRITSSRYGDVPVVDLSPRMINMIVHSTMWW